MIWQVGSVRQLAFNSIPFLLLVAGCAGSVMDAEGTVGAASVQSGQAYSLVRQGSGKCMDVGGWGTNNGTQILQWSCHGGANQQFRVVNVGDHVQLVDSHSGRCLDVDAWGTADGTKIQLWDCNGSPAQSYFLDDMGNGFLRIRNTHSNKCVDVTAASNDDGPKVQLYSCNGTSAQNWRPVGPGTTNPPAPPGWKLTWSDEFNGGRGAIDGSKWGFETGNNGWGNSELEFYTNRTDNAFVDGGGNLQIVARKESYGGSSYTSARITTAGHFGQTYGRIEARIKTPAGRGIWPAFWMLGTDIGSVGWPNCGEIDIMEAVIDFSVNHGTIHGPGYSGGAGPTGTFQNNGSLANDFHVYAVEWEPNQIRWYVDGNLYETRTSADAHGNRWVFDHPFYLLLNVAVGGNWPGSPDGSTSFPQTMLVDYVRVFSR
jgi:beta-glucanase (GH16 family)